MKKNFGTIGKVIFAIILLSWCSNVLERYSNKPFEEINQAIPDNFRTQNINGYKDAISKETFLSDNISVLVLFAPWCPPCRSEHAFFMKISKDKEFNLFGLSVTSSEKSTLDFLEKRGSPYDLVSIDKNGGEVTKITTPSLPQTMIIDRAGNIRYIVRGEMNEKIWNKLIKPKIIELKKEVK